MDHDRNTFDVALPTMPALYFFAGKRNPLGTRQFRSTLQWSSTWFVFLQLRMVPPNAEEAIRVVFDCGETVRLHAP